MSKNNKEQELKPCPFCGGKADQDIDNEWIFCIECGVGYAGRYRRKQWNTRPDAQEVKKDLKAIMLERDELIDSNVEILEENKELKERLEQIYKLAIDSIVDDLPLYHQNVINQICDLCRPPTNQGEGAGRISTVVRLKTDRKLTFYTVKKSSLGKVRKYARYKRAIKVRTKT